MGSGGWIKTIIGRKKVRQGKSKQPKGSKSKNGSQKNISNATNGASGGNSRVLCMPREDIAALRIQTAFRAYLAKKALRQMKGAVRLQNLAQRECVKKQSLSTLNHLQSWTRIQAEIKERRLCMVIEGRLKQKKLENQLKLEAKLHDLEVEWCGGSETMEEILARIHHREEAAVKRERALAYAFSHQWRANSVHKDGADASELGKANWGWSWKERWVAARPWENRLQSQSVSPKKGRNKSASKASKDKFRSGTSSQTDLKSKNKPLGAQGMPPVKSAVPNGNRKGSAAGGRRLSFPNSTEQEISTNDREATGTNG